jgi:hypothetical protein
MKFLTGAEYAYNERSGYEPTPWDDTFSTGSGSVGSALGDSVHPMFLPMNTMRVQLGRPLGTSLFEIDADGYGVSQQPAYNLPPY